MDRRTRRNRIAFEALVVVAGLLAGCATFRGSLPVELGGADGLFISPGIPDGIQDRLIIPATIPAPYEGMALGGYRFTVMDASGRAVRTIEESVVAQGRKLSLSLRPREGIRPPASLIWEGRDDRGDLVPEGEYAYAVTAWDLRGNAGESPRFRVTVDNTRPSAEPVASEHTFSPNGDGNLDVLHITHQRSSTEDRWVGEIRSADGTVLRHVAWAGVPEDVIWDGGNEEGGRAPDGVYAYVLSSTDRAGNAASISIEGIRLDTRPATVTVVVRPRSISPNGDGTLDAASIRLIVDGAESVERWAVVVRDEELAVRRLFTDVGRPPESILFDGRDDGGATLVDGLYSVAAEIWYRNGDNPRVSAPPLAVDTTPPAARLGTSAAVFSPDGDGNVDVLRVEQQSSLEAEWEGAFLDAAGRPVASRYWQGLAEPFEWDGRDDAGTIVPDGLYRYVLSSTDEAGNTGTASVTSIRVDTRPTPVSLGVELFAFSPNGDGRRDAVRFLPTASVVEGMEAWSLDVLDPEGAVVRSFGGTGSLPEAVSFDGKDADGRLLPDAAGYRGLLTVSYRKGDTARARSPAVVLDTQAPWARVRADELVLSPDGDGRGDRIAIGQIGSVEDLWLGSIMSPAGRTVFARSWRGQPQSFDWDGRDSGGTVVPDGVYAYRLTATDAAENRVTVELAGIQLDTRAAEATLAASAPALSPNGDGIADVVTLRMSATTEGLRSWHLGISDASRREVRLFGGSGALGLPPELVWDGRDESGGVTEGAYDVQLVVEYDRGSVARAALAAPLVVDVTGPRMELDAGPLPFSPDGDGVNDTLSIAARVQDASPLYSWSMEVIDPEGRVFTRFSGRGAPLAPVRWDGRSPDGELVQGMQDYRIALAAVDYVGNAGGAEATVPTDILILPEGDQLRIVVSSIYFQEFTASYLDVPPERARRNLEILDRLGQRLRLLPDYDIRIEGHAARVYWYDPDLLLLEEKERLAPLSLERAQVVKQALVDRGVPADRVSGAGFGGTRPVVPHSDLRNLWRNRRVEFVLTKR